MTTTNVLTEETLSVRHRDILTKATNLTEPEIWQALIDFVLFGKPKHQGDPRIYYLYWCWKTIIEMQFIERDYTDGWPDPLTKAAHFLGWEYTRLSKACVRYNREQYDDDSRLANAVVKTIMYFMEDSDAPENLVDLSQPPTNDHGFRPKTWCWYVKLNVPAFVIKIRPGMAQGTMIHPSIVLGSVISTMVDILIPPEDHGWEQLTQGDGPCLDPPQNDKYVTIFTRKTVPLDEISHIRLDLDELDY